MNKILLQCDNLCKRYQEGNVQTEDRKSVV